MTWVARAGCALLLEEPLRLVAELRLTAVVQCVVGGKDLGREGAHAAAFSLRPSCIVGVMGRSPALLAIGPRALVGSQY